MSSHLWNQFHLKPPPNFTCRLKTADTDLRKLSDVFWEALTTLQNQQLLHNEAATLSRLIYRMKSMLRGDKGFKCMEKVNHCLRQYLALDLVPLYDNMFRSIPWERADSEIYCPTLQMLEHIMLRTQGLGALLSRIVHTCQEAGYFLKTRLNSGHNWQVAFISLGAVSRIWALTKHLLECCVKWYSVMHPFLHVLKHNGPLWLPQDYVFPRNLQTWLAVPWLQSSPKANRVSSDTWPHLSSNTNTSLKAPIERRMEAKPQSAFVDNSASVAHLPIVQRLADMTDLGESISRDSLLPAGQEKIVEESNEHLKGDVSMTNKWKKQKTKKLDRCSTGDNNLSEFMDKAVKGSPQVCATRDDTEEMSPLVTKTRKRKRRKTRTVPSEGKEEVENINKNNSKTGKKVKHEVMTSKELVIESNGQALKAGNIKRVITALKSHTDVEILLKQESRKRIVTSTLDNTRWEILKSLLVKFISKIKKAQSEEKQDLLMKQIQKALKVALL